MLRLIAMRHAEAAYGPTDADRPLSSYGEREARGAGSWLREHGLVPDLVLCSTARRTRQTWTLISGELSTDAPVCYESAIYENDVDVLLDLVRRTDDSTDSLLLVGHNPAVHQLVLTLTDEHERRQEFPAGSVAVVTLPGSWQEITPGEGSLNAFWTP